MKHRTIASILAGLLLLSGFARSGQLPAAAAQGDAVSQLFQLVNQVRADHGLAPFQWDASLAAAAQNQADHNAATATYGHSGYGGTSPQDRAAAAGYSGYVVENVVGGWDLTPQQGVVWWINSPVHYNTLITTRYAVAGTGFSANGRQNHYTLVVGRPRSGSTFTEAPQAQNEPPAIVIPITLSEPDENGAIIHRIQQGQTLWAIAARYSVKLSDLRLFNNLGDSDLVRPGDELIVKLAEGQAPPPTPTPPLTYIVQAGETAWTIAARFNLKIDEILWYNNLTEDALIRPGDELIVRLMPGQSPPPTPTPQAHHIVQAGDSMWAIAARYGLTLEQFQTLNGLGGNSVLQPGDRLLIRALPTPTPTSAATAQAQLPAVTAAAGGPDSPDPTAERDLTPFAPASPDLLSVLPPVPTPTPAPVIADENPNSAVGTAAFGAAILFSLLALLLFFNIRRS